MGLENRHFQKHGPFLNILKNKAMFVKIQNFAFRSSNMISPDSFLKFCSLFYKKYPCFLKQLWFLNIKQLILSVYLLFKNTIRVIISVKKQNSSLDTNKDNCLKWFILTEKHILSSFALWNKHVNICTWNKDKTIQRYINTYTHINFHELMSL